MRSPPTAPTCWRCERRERRAAHRALAEPISALFRWRTALTRLANRFCGAAAPVEAAARARQGEPLDAAAALELGLVTVAPDELDWEDELRLAIEERASLSPDALSGLEANLRFAGPETMETRIFGRLSAWQNWIFGRPNAVGERGRA